MIPWLDCRSISGCQLPRIVKLEEENDMTFGGSDNKTSIGTIVVYCLLTAIAAWAGAVGASSTASIIAPSAANECLVAPKGAGS